MNKIILLFSITFFSACATLDKAMTPIDKGLNSTKTIYNEASNSVSETIGDIGNMTDNITSSIQESALIRWLSDDSTVLKNRTKNFVIWNDSSKYRLKKILKTHLVKSDIKNPDQLESSQKMIILKDHFFKLLKQQHADKFSKASKKPEFDKFLTDRENINKIHEYKAALLESEHQWRLNLRDTQKKVAQMMLSTLYSRPLLKFVSYNPYEKELFLSIEAATGNFKEKFKINADKDLAKSIEKDLIRIKPFVFYKFDDDVLEFVGISLVYKKKAYNVDIVESTYVRNSNVVFKSGDISLEDLNVQYYDIVKNIKPPKWFNNMSAKRGQIIGYGEGIKKDDAKKEAFKDIATSIQTTINSTTQTKQVYSGSFLGISSTTSTEQIVENISIKGSKVINTEKKDGLWFVAISHEQ